MFGCLHEGGFSLILMWRVVCDRDFTAADAVVATRKGRVRLKTMEVHKCIKVQMPREWQRIMIGNNYGHSRLCSKNCMERRKKYRVNNRHHEEAKKLNKKSKKQ